MFLFSISTTCKQGGRIRSSSLQIDLDVQNSQSPVVLALHRLTENSKINPIEVSKIYAIKNILNFFVLALPHHMETGISNHTRESFDDFLYQMETKLNERDLSISSRRGYWEVLRNLLKLNVQPLGDGTTISSCIRDYVSAFKNEKGAPSPSRHLSAIPHRDLNELEAKARNITRGILDRIIGACEKDIQEYLDICKMQNNFSNSQIDPSIYRQLVTTVNGQQARPDILKKQQPDDILKFIFALLKKTDELKFTEQGMSAQYNFPAAKFVPLLESFPHYRSAKSSQPWYFCQYRLPNHVLTSIFILLLVKTSWNISSVGDLRVCDIKKLKNSTTEIQSSKDRSKDNTPTVTISKSDKYLNISISLLLWNHSQLQKYQIITSTNDCLWYGWQHNYDQPYYPLYGSRLITFFSRHKIPEIPPSEIRPLKSAYNFLEHNDIELIRIALGHSSLETTNCYLKDNLIFHLNESRILEFQRRLETTVALNSNIQQDLDQRGFNRNYVDQSLIGSQSKEEMEFEKQFVNEANTFLELLGVKPTNGSPLVTAEAMTQAILLKRYYKLRWKQLYDKNPRYFATHHFIIIIYLTAFLRIGKERKPLIYNELNKSILGNH